MGSHPGIPAAHAYDPEHPRSPARPPLPRLQTGPIKRASPPKGVAPNITQLERGRALGSDTWTHLLVRFPSQPPALQHVTRKWRLTLRCPAQRRGRPGCGVSQPCSSLPLPPVSSLPPLFLTCLNLYHGYFVNDPQMATSLFKSSQNIIFRLLHFLNKKDTLLNCL